MGANTSYSNYMTSCCGELLIPFTHLTLGHMTSSVLTLHVSRLSTYRKFKFLEIQLYYEFKHEMIFHIWHLHITHGVKQQQYRTPLFLGWINFWVTCEDTRWAAERTARFKVSNPPRLHPTQVQIPSFTTRQPGDVSPAFGNGAHDEMVNVSGMCSPGKLI